MGRDVFDKMNKRGSGGKGEGKARQPDTEDGFGLARGLHFER